MRQRQEFSTKVKVAAFERAGGRCEICGSLLMPGKFRYDHRIPDFMGGKPDLANCQAICVACDKPKTAKDQGQIAKVKRLIAKRAGVKKPSRFACGRDSKWRKKISGEVVPR